ncbi:ribosome biogenesis BMS1-like protein [Micractinium conductrix]|uniref:Ribosome biogenesis BMS1-like protein n=1 Tax=Micractinium conductrix TaxID=554055 RepID=A0A2P6VRI7_9CHLO|nr:ribosome biogenesis BMS1-like protein [Micractinium conductrix]|eukprot:PSC76713.1 ribosome biogenesis BMS1-like protein [Micractinium conductrix]
MGGEGKGHRKKKSGRKAEKRKAAEGKKKTAAAGGGDGDAGAAAPRKVISDEQARKQNPKAFVFSSRGKAKLQQARTAEKEQRRMHVPMMEKGGEEPPPFTILVHGPPGVGKTTLIKGLIKHYTRQDVREVKGPITLIAGKQRRLTFIECPQDLSAMIDAAKYADLVLLLIDGGFGFEMETFEFLNLLQVHGFPKVMGVLTHLDGFKDTKALKKTKKGLKHRFWTEIYQGAKLFYLSGMKNGKYMKREVHNLARFISVMKFRPLSWRQCHPYLVADRFEDITPVEAVRANPRCDRDVSLYGYVRGCNWKEGARVHIAGVGDYSAREVAALHDPCPLPDKQKKRSLNERERLVYAPMSDVGGLLFDKDAVYIDIPDWKVQFTSAGVGGAEAGGEGEAMVRGLQATRLAVDEKLEKSKIQLFAGGRALKGDEVESDEGEEEEEESDAEDDGEGSSGSELGSDEEEGDELSDDDEEIEPAGRTGRGTPQQQVVRAADGRVRRRAIFGSEALPADGGDSSSGEESEDEEEEGGSSDEEAEQEWAARQQRGAAAGGPASDGEEEESEGESDEDDEEGIGAAAKWKANMLQRAAALFSTRGADLHGYIYGTRATADASWQMQGLSLGGGGDDDDDEELFRPKRQQAADQQAGSGAAGGGDPLDAPDSSRAAVPPEILAAWGDEGAVERLRNRFVTGDWGEGEARAAARPEEGEGEGEDAEEVFGDFEDVETGERFAGSEDPATRAAAAAIKAATEEELAEKRRAKKAAFDSEYDEGGGAKAVQDAQAKGKGKGKKKEEEDEPETYYDAMKRELVERAAKTRTALDAFDPATRVAMEGHRPGAYVRLRFSGVPCELVTNFDPRFPILVGGLQQGEEALGTMQMRLKRHRWFPKTLKNRDPLIFSVGWRRFQSLPVFATEDNNGRYRMLKYSPEHMHCLATVWGPLAPPSTGVLAVQKLDGGQANWRIAATGVILQLDAAVRIVKKLKLVGTPFKIHRHTAFINGMFNSLLEASKFEGASVRTVSGIRGTIKKAVKAGREGARDGAYRASFEDKPLMSDIIFLRAWVAVDLPKLYNPVTNLLAPHAPAKLRQPKHRRKQKRLTGGEEEGVDGEDAGGAGDDVAGLGPGSAIDAAAAAAAAAAGTFVPASKWGGRRPGFAFKLGPLGLGYYPDHGLSGTKAAGATAAAAAAAAGAAAAAAAGGGGGGDANGSAAAAGGAGWVPMKTVADLRRALGVGAPRDSDSLYRKIERRPKKFNPLRVPKSLQAALPFKTKPKLEQARKHKSLEQKRAVVLEPGERRTASLVSQLNAIRNQKAVARREQRARQKETHAKKQAAEEAWREQYNKEERKKRCVEKGKADQRAAKKQRRGE